MLASYGKILRNGEQQYLWCFRDGTATRAGKKRRFFKENF